MPDTRIHIVSFDVPYPADYGGVIDIFYKLKALHELGVKVVLHAFTYGKRQPREELKAYCEAVHYYPRNMSLLQLLSKKPFIVISRTDRRLLENILSDPAPVLLEGWHTCGILKELKEKGLPVFVRSHNMEDRYYQGLSENSDRLPRRWYYGAESRKLGAFRPQLAAADHIFAISLKDSTSLSAHFPQTEYLPVFHPHEQVVSLVGTGTYALYHGNLGVEENSAALAWLLREVWPGVGYPLKIAGKDAPGWLQDLAERTPGVTLLGEVGDLQALVRDAQMHVLPAVQDTGIKLKLLYALFAGRHCVVNQLMVAGTGLEALCRVANTPVEWQEVIQEMSEEQFTVAEIEKRKAVLLPAFDNRVNARKFMASSGLLPS